MWCVVCVPFVKWCFLKIIICVKVNKIVVHACKLESSRGYCLKRNCVRWIVAAGGLQLRNWLRKVKGQATWVPSKLDLQVKMVKRLRELFLWLVLLSVSLSDARDFTFTLKLGAGRSECFYDYIHEGAFLEIEYQVACCVGSC